DGAFVAEDLLAVAVMIVAEIAGVVDVELIVLVDGAQRIGHFAVVVFVGPAIDAAARPAGFGYRFIQHEVDDVGLMHQQVGGDAAGIIPVEAPLEVALRIPIALGRGAQETVEIGVLGRGIGRDGIAPGRVVGQRVAVPEGAHVMYVAHHALFDKFLGLLIERRTAVLGAHLYNFPGLLPYLADIEALFDGVGERFFDVDVFD